METEERSSFSREAHKNPGSLDVKNSFFHTEVYYYLTSLTHTTMKQIALSALTAVIVTVLVLAAGRSLPFPPEKPGVHGEPGRTMATEESPASEEAMIIA